MVPWGGKLHNYKWVIKIKRMVGSSTVWEAAFLKTMLRKSPVSAQSNSCAWKKINIDKTQLIFSGGLMLQQKKKNKGYYLLQYNSAI